MAATRQRSVIIIGAGVGGVASAARLAKAGCKVTVVEKNDFTGGRCSLKHNEGYRFDQGPSLLLLPDLFRETFTDLNTTMEAENIHLHKCEPNYQIFFHDNEKITLSTDLAHMKTEIEKWEGKNGFERYLRWLTESHRHYELSVKQVLRRNFYNILSMMRLDLLANVTEMHALTPMYTRASKYFWTDRLRRCFTFGSMYMGMSPFDAPAVYSLLQYTELAEGIWYPEGGFHKVVDGLVNIGKRLGVDMRLSSPVKSIDLSKGKTRAIGVTLESGEELDADIVLINADLVYAYNNLFPTKTPYAERLSKKPASCSSISFYWSLDRQFPELKAHNIFLAKHYQESFDDIFDKHTMPEEPSFYVNVPSRIDATAAPDGKDAIVVLLPCGHMKEPGVGGIEEQEEKFAKLVEISRQIVIDTIEKRTGITGLRESVIAEMINTPLSWKDTFNLDKGSILGLSIDFFNALAFRPSTKHESIQNCYFVGASTHPGTGVPVCLAGAKLTCEQVLEEANMPIPWSKALAPDHQARKSGSKLDVIRRMGLNTSGMGSVELGAWGLIFAFLVSIIVGITSRIDWR